MEIVIAVSTPKGEILLDSSINRIQQDNSSVIIVGVSKIISDEAFVKELYRETEGHFQFITENATDIILRLAKDSTFLYASPIIEKILGIRPKDILYASTFYDIVYAEDQYLFFKSHQQLLESESKIVTFSYRAQRSDGEII